MKISRPNLTSELPKVTQTACGGAEPGPRYSRLLAVLPTPQVSWVIGKYTGWGNSVLPGQGAAEGTARQRQSTLAE